MKSVKASTNEIASAPGRPASPRDTEGDTILVVAKRTGLPMETLRAWERRYGFPAPERRPGSNRRLYSQADIEKLIAIRHALDLGYRVGDVVGKSSAELAALGGPQGAPAEARERLGRDVSLSDLPEELVAMLAREEIVAIEGALRHAASALGPRRFVTEVAHPFAVRVGTAWADGQISVRHEHVATECLVTRLRVLLSNYQDLEGRPVVLLATLPGEPHGLALQMVALYLATAGARPRLLGVSTPPGDVLEAASAFRADVVGLTVTPVVDPHESRRHVKFLRKRLDAAVPLWLGGAGAGAIGSVEGDVQVATTWSALDDALLAWRRSKRVER